MLGPSAEVEIALTIIQAVGLLLPVIFIALQPFYEPVAKDAVGDDTSPPQELSDKGFENENEDENEPTIIWVIDKAPLVIKGGIPIAVLLTGSVLFAGLRVVQYVFGSWLITISLVCLIFGVLGLGVLFYLVRREFIKDGPSAV